MLPVLFIATILLLMYNRIRIQRDKNVSLKYQYRLYALRDKLRMHVINGKIKKEYWLFNFFDNSICKMIGYLDGLTIYSAVFLILKHKNDECPAKMFEKVQKELSCNRYLSDLDKEYNNIISDYFSERHNILIPVVVFAFSTLNMLTKFKSEGKKKVVNIKLLPETSDYSYAA
jgi:hypothetical protein